MKFYPDFHWETRPWRRTLTRGSDVKDVFPTPYPCLYTVWPHFYQWARWAELGRRRDWGGKLMSYPISRVLLPQSLAYSCPSPRSVSPPLCAAHLTQELDGRLGAVLLLGRHVQVVHEHHALLAGRRAVHALTAPAARTTPLVSQCQLLKNYFNSVNIMASTTKASGKLGPNLHRKCTWYSLEGQPPWQQKPRGCDMCS